MRYLIDGYNLLFATGRLIPRIGRGGLEASRKWLLVEVVRWHGTDAADVTVVFDAAGAPARLSAREEHGGVRVMYSRGQTADDVIEELIRDEPTPRLLTVVSDDNRIKEAARRRGCVVEGCLDYCEHRQQGRRAVAAPRGEPAKPDAMTEEERKHWLEAFGDVEDSGDPF